MAKRRKRSTKDVPAKGRLMEIADDQWSLAVRTDWDWRCAVCGRVLVEAHHIVPRQYEATRYDMLNGIALCAHCHKLGKDSAHQHAPAWMAWLQRNHPTRHKKATDDPRPSWNGIKNWPYYCDVIRVLKEYVEPDDYERIVGVRFAAWLEENE